MENLAQTFLKLSPEDFLVLSSIESGMRGHEWVPLELVAKVSGLSSRRAEYRLHLLSELHLISSENLHYHGYQIDFDAYDLLALADLVKRDYVASIGDKVGVGKESVVYEALGEIPLVIKFHRQGRTSFKHVRRHRDHLTDLPRVPWLYAAAIAARHEFRVMQRLYPQVSIPRPIALSRHALAMELISGLPLNRVELSNPQEALDIILEEIGRAYGLGIVHADLSEFNVLVAEENLKIIDWPQAVNADHAAASELLRRDVGNIVRYFFRRYKIDLSLDEALARVSGRGQEAMV
ncbi:MAG: serine/threonine protein kinase [Methanotrichaceae archaeon]|nr:serine/threonine protein kinase [Methanotrichaceae archaeon]